MKLSKKLFSVLFCAIIVLGSVTVGCDDFADVLEKLSLRVSAASYSDGTGSNDGWADGTHIRFGSYPQTDVTASMGSTLDAKATGWKSYKYYSGTGDLTDGQMKDSDYMMYCDVKTGGNKYRGVKFSTYRPCWTGYASTTSVSDTNQDDNGYTVGNTYWFKYEPLVWRVLDSSTGLVMCESIIDSQAYNNYIWYDVGSECYGNEAHTKYANDYYNSSIRKWLTEDFYATAFSKSQQNKLLKYNCDNSCYSSLHPEYDSRNSRDKVFLLSYDEVKNSAYGFNSDPNAYDIARRAKGTDYAKCQGLYVSKSSGSASDGNSRLWLRSPASLSNFAYAVEFDGGCSDYYSRVGSTYIGVRPALKLNLSSEIFQSDYAGSEIGSSGSDNSSVGNDSKKDSSSNNSDKSDNNDFLYTNLDPANKSDYDPAEIIENQAGLDSGFNNKNGNKSNNETKILLGALIALAVIILAILIIFLIKRNEKQPTVNKDFVAPEYYPVEPPYQLIPGGSYGVCQRCKNETDNIFIFKMKENGVEHSAQVCENCGKELAEMVKKRKR